VIEIRVYGTPAPQGSKRRGQHGGVYEQVKGVKPWREDVKQAALQWIREGGETVPFGQFVLIRAVFLYNRPKSHYRTGRNSHLLKDSAPERPLKGDTDKLARSTNDALTTAGIWADDKFAADQILSKMWTRPGDQPGAIITIEPAKTEDY